MNWTKELPKEDGWYWTHSTTTKVPVLMYQSDLSAVATIYDANDSDIYWYGPIELPRREPVRPPKFEEEGELEDD